MVLLDNGLGNIIALSLAGSGIIAIIVAFFLYTRLKATKFYKIVIACTISLLLFFVMVWIALNVIGKY